jgi:hypothetical protein
MESATVSLVAGVLKEPFVAAEQPLIDAALH